MQTNGFRQNFWLLAALVPLISAPGGLRPDENPYGLHADHITAVVTDIARATAWYHDMLGFKITNQGSRMNGEMKFSNLRIPGFGVSLVQLRRPALEPSPGQLVRPAWVHITFAVADPNRLFHQLRERGARVSTREPVTTAAVKTFLLYDSEGNEIEIVAKGSG